MKNWHSVVAGPIVFGLIYFILWSHGSWMNYYADSISRETLSKEYRVVKSQEKLTFDTFTYDKKNCILDKVILNNTFVYDAKYCTETEDYKEDVKYDEIDCLVDDKITDRFGDVCIFKNTIQLEDLRIDYHKNIYQTTSPPKFKIYNDNLYVFYIHEYDIYASVINRDAHNKLVLLSQTQIKYETDIIGGLPFFEFDFEVLEGQIIFTGGNVANVFFSSWNTNIKQQEIKFENLFNEVSGWKEGSSIFLRNKSDIFIVFQTGYSYVAVLDEKLFFIGKYDSGRKSLKKLKSFRDIDIKLGDRPSGANSYIKIDDNEDIYFKSYDGNVYTINYNSLSEVDTLAEFTKKKFLNLFK